MSAWALFRGTRVGAGFESQGYNVRGTQVEASLPNNLAPCRYMFDAENLVTVWSAPNYCYRCGNVASILAFDDQLNREPKYFNAVPDDQRVIPPRTTTPYFL